LMADRNLDTLQVKRDRFAHGTLGLVVSRTDSGAP
jgi:hypothetical protein